MSNLVPLTRPNLQILGKVQTEVFPISEFLVNLLWKLCHNSRTSDVIDMELRPVSRLDKRNKTTSKKKLNDEVISKNCDVIVIFTIANLEQSRSRIPDL